MMDAKDVDESRIAIDWPMALSCDRTRMLKHTKEACRVAVSSPLYR